jgi:signal peptidase I
MATKRSLLAALLSALVPGSGHIYLGLHRKGTVLLALLVALLIGFWPLRLLHFYFGFCLLYGGWIVLYVYSPVSALIARGRSVSKAPSKWWLVLFVPLSLVVLDLAGIAVTRASGFRSFEVPSTSMERTIQAGDRIVADVWYYNSKAPKREDIVIFRNKCLFIVKRVIAVGGDTIIGKDGLVVLNGQALDEPFVEHRGLSSPFWLNTFGPITVSSDKYFVMGDNRDISLDSRSPEVGLLDKRSVVGKALYVVSSTRQGTKIQ